jgi:chromate transporter
MNLVKFLLELAGFNGLALGNGQVMLPMIRKSYVEDRGLLTLDQMLYAFAIAQVVPGQANLYVASIGYMLFGVGAAFLAIGAINAPAYLMLPVVRWYRRIQHVRAVQKATRGLTSASVGLICASTLLIARDALKRPECWVVFLLTLAFSRLLKWNALMSLTAACAAGVALRMALP